MLTCSVQSDVVQFCGLVSVFLVRKMGDLALHSALDARLETKKKTQCSFLCDFIFFLFSLSLSFLFAIGGEKASLRKHPFSSLFAD